MSPTIGACDAVTGNVASLLWHAAERHGARPAVVEREQRATYAALLKRVGAIAAALVAAGVTPDDPVAILLERGGDAAAAASDRVPAGAFRRAPARHDGRPACPPAARAARRRLRAGCGDDRTGRRPGVRPRAAGGARRGADHLHVRFDRHAEGRDGHSRKSPRRHARCGLLSRDHGGRPRREPAALQFRVRHEPAAVHCGGGGDARGGAIATPAANRRAAARG